MVILVCSECDCSAGCVDNLGPRQVDKLVTGSTADLGFTGSLGTSIAAAPVTSSTANTPVVFTEYYQASALPTSWTVPCEGSGMIAFTPKPGSSTARTDFVTVRFINIAA